MSAIPKRMEPEFVAFMDAFNNDDLPDGAWFAMLEDGARAFAKHKKLRIDANDAVHQYLQAKP